MLEIRELAVEAAGRRILEGVSLAIPAGEIHALQGPNGSGKTSLALSIVGHPDYSIEAGDIRWNGESILNKKPHERARLGIHWLPQSVPAFEGVGLLSMARAAADARGAKPDIFVLRSELAAALKRLGLSEDFLLRPLHGDSSGGEKKKIELALSAVLKPEFLILDEVDAGLDAAGIAAAADVIAEIAKNAAVLAISHSNAFLERLGVRRRYRMEAGKFIHEH
ncbi:MAG: ATP-binding cassette domain-containing protein [Candidatus Niyogibacteria bacterium]|nr:ATP-binding cassette domain-containing protein [Candidatus Niyogibacteria bacterium]